MSDRSEPSVASGVVFIIIGLLCAAIGVMGVTYSLDESSARKAFLKDQTGTLVTMKEASTVMMGLGFLGGAGLIGYGVYRTMPLKEEEGGAPEVEEGEEEDGA